MKISIVVPYHNEGRNIISRLLQSIDQQLNINFNDIEVLICSAAATSASFDLSDFTNIKNQTYFLHHIGVNEGPGEARNIGLNASKGDYVLFCDCDDELASNDTLSTILNVIETNKDLYNFNFNIIDNGNTTIGSNECPFQLWASVYKKSFLIENNINFSPTFYGEDLEFVAKVETCRAISEYHPISIYNYILRNGSAVTTRYQKYFMFMFDTLSAINNIHTWWQSNKISLDYQLPIFTKILSVIPNELSIEAFSALSANEQNLLINLINQILIDYRIQIYLYSSMSEYAYFLTAINRLQDFLHEVA